VGWLWDDRLAEVWAWPAEAGSGVGFGARGVLTVRHVVAKAMDDYRPGAPAMRAAAMLLDHLQRTDEALALYLRLAEIGGTDAFKDAARLLSRADRAEEEHQLRRYGLEPGGRIAATWSVEPSS
jgi:hypothetical protein